MDMLSARLNHPHLHVPGILRTTTVIPAKAGMANRNMVIQAFPSPATLYPAHQVPQTNVRGACSALCRLGYQWQPIEIVAMQP